MRTVKISLPTAERVQAFVEALTPLDGDFELLSGQYILDARSLMGIFGLDLTRPVELRIYNDTPRTMQALKQFTTEEAEQP